jgi:signal transduction histidine kinase/HAMP domain-containing protein
MGTGANPNTHRPLRRFMSLRSKFVLFFSLIIIATCSGLSAYFIRDKRESMTAQLLDLGNILVNNLAYNGKFGIITEDQVLLSRLIDGALAVDDVVYVMITGPEGRQLAAKTKGRLSDTINMVRDPHAVLYPTASSAQTLLASRTSAVTVTSFNASHGESIYDFAVAVVRQRALSDLQGPLQLESVERHPPSVLPTESPPQMLGVIQIGLTDAKRSQDMRAVIRDVTLLTALIILIGILATAAMVGRISTPLKSLSSVARRVAEGDLSASVNPTTNDEVGHLTEIFNQMTRSLNERDQAISAHIDIIRRQVRQLTSLNQTSAAIASTLDLDKLLDVVLQLCVDNAGFSRMVLVLYDPDRQTAYGARVVGLPEDVEKETRQLEIPILDDGGTDAELLIHGKPLLVPDISAVADRMYPPALVLCRQLDVSSFIAAPLKTKDHILGYISADFADRRCTQEDLDLLITIASHIAVAIDNAHAYQKLEHLTQTLEQRVQSRTQELQNANERLIELDKLRAAFVSIVSHELRTPMTSIKGYVENMLDGLTGTLTDRQSYYLTRVKFNVERLTRMLNQLLDLSRIEAGRVELNLAPLSLTDLAADVVEGLQSLAQKKNLVLTARSQRCLQQIYGDRDKLHQVMTNLVGNAIKFTPPNGQIYVDVNPASDATIQVCVSDTGCGIATHELEKVFEKFYRGETAPQEALGAGLGLPITKHLVELHGGVIWVESTVGQGCQFYFTVPASGPSAHT